MFLIIVQSTGDDHDGDGGDDVAVITEAICSSYTYLIIVHSTGDCHDDRSVAVITEADYAQQADEMCTWVWHPAQIMMMMMMMMVMKSLQMLI